MSWASAAEDIHSFVRVKVATEEWEFDQIHRLNYHTFVEEIPQHRANASAVLVDRFHHENTYIIAVDRARVVGMLAVRGNRPFSLDAKLPDLDAYLPPARRVCEFRLLAIEERYRAGRLLYRLMSGVWSHCAERGYDLAVMSGTTRQLKLYRHLGFAPFGPIVGEPGAYFQPMMLTLEGARPLVRRLVGPPAADADGMVNLLPGPVPVRAEVEDALRQPAASHRSHAFAADFASTQATLCCLTGAARAEVLVGSGTLANDAIAGQLSLAAGSGLILTNGEFGDRLVDHAARFGLRYDVMRWAWGNPFDLAAVERRLTGEPAPCWLWFVHLETSTGVLNDLAALKTLCSSAGVDLCVDAVSSLGVVGFDLERVRLASSASGKGLGAFPGLAIVLHHDRLEPSGGRLPRYLDLTLYARETGVPFTHSSNLVRALRKALERGDWAGRFRLLERRSRWLRAHLRECGYKLVAEERHAAPGVVTIVLPPSVDSVTVGAALEDSGFAIAANSEYLQRRNWIQISVMAEPARSQLRTVVEALGRICTPAAAC